MGLLALVAGSGAITADSNRDRTISFYGVNTKETLTIQYMKNGKHIPEAMEKINWMLRDWRKDEPTKMDPDLIDLVWEIHNELGSAEPINIISAYRSRDTNEMLRRTVGGQASQSRHILGKAMDVTFPDVPVKKLRYSALIRERGGVGYYPTSATPFVHIDTDRVRAWPRVPRMELALLLPKRPHAACARRRRGDHARGRAPGARRQLGDRRSRSPSSTSCTSVRGRADPGCVADALAAAAAVPRRGWWTAGAGSAPVRRIASGRRSRRWPTSRCRGCRRSGAGEPPAAAPGAIVTSGEMRLAAADPGASAALDRLKWGAIAQPRAPFVPAPAYDEEHPEELSYRPFPIAPFLTATACADDPALARMVHPDLNKTLEMLDQAVSVPPMRLRPGPQTAQLMWAQQFKGEAINLSSLIDLGCPAARAGAAGQAPRA